MKKSALLITAALTLSLSFASSSLASPASIKLQLASIPEGTVRIVSDDAFNGVGLPALLLEDSLYVKAANSVGLNESWSMDEKAETERVIISREVTVFTGKDARIIARGEVIPVDDKVLKQLQRGYYPVRLVYELAKYQVSYNPSEETITIASLK